MYGKSSSPLVAALGFLVAVVAFVGTRYYGWEWGNTGQTLPVAVAVIATLVGIVVTLRRVR